MTEDRNRSLGVAAEGTTSISQHYLSLAEKGCLPDDLMCTAVSAAAMLVEAAVRRYPDIREQIESHDINVQNPDFYAAALALMKLGESDRLLHESGVS